MLRCSSLRRLLRSALEDGDGGDNDGGREHGGAGSGEKAEGIEAGVTLLSATWCLSELNMRRYKGRIGTTGELVDDGCGVDRELRTELFMTARGDANKPRSPHRPDVRSSFLHEWMDVAIGIMYNKRTADMKNSRRHRYLTCPVHRGLWRHKRLDSVACFGGGGATVMFCAEVVSNIFFGQKTPLCFSPISCCEGATHLLHFERCLDSTKAFERRSKLFAVITFSLVDQVLTRSVKIVLCVQSENHAWHVGRSCIE